MGIEIKSGILELRFFRGNIIIDYAYCIMRDQKYVKYEQWLSQMPSK